jgi:hypothetical protein
MEPSDRKSAVLAEVAEPLRAYEAKQQEMMGPSVLASQRRIEVLHRRRRKAIAELAEAEEPMPGLEHKLAGIESALRTAERVVRPRLLADDVTPEKLVQLMGEQGGRIALFSAGGAVLDQIGRPGSRGNGLDVYLKAFSGDALHVDRKAGTSVSIVEPALTVGVAVQHAVARDLAARASNQERGLLSRVLYVMPASMAGRREVLVPPVSNEIRQDYARTIRRLLDIRQVRRRGEIVSHDLVLSDDALARYLQFAESVEPHLGRGGKLDLCGWGGKLVGSMLRISALLHLVRYSMTTPVTVEAVDSAIRIANYLIPHARAAFGLMAIDPRVADARHILKMMLSKGITEIRHRDLTEVVKGRVKPVADRFAPAMQLLVANGYIRLEERSVPGASGPKPKFYILNPHVCLEHLAQWGQP